MNQTIAALTDAGVLPDVAQAEADRIDASLATIIRQVVGGRDLVLLVVDLLEDELEDVLSWVSTLAELFKRDPAKRVARIRARARRERNEGHALKVEGRGRSAIRHQEKARDLKAKADRLSRENGIPLPSER